MSGITLNTLELYGRASALAGKWKALYKQALSGFPVDLSYAQCARMLALDYALEARNLKRILNTLFEAAEAEAEEQRSQIVSLSALADDLRYELDRAQNPILHDPVLARVQAISNGRRALAGRAATANDIDALSTACEWPAEQILEREG